MYIYKFIKPLINIPGVYNVHVNSDVLTSRNNAALGQASPANYDYVAEILK
jgi:hypothetical protein